MNTDRNLKAVACTTFSHSGRRPCQEDFVLADREKGIFVIADGFGGPIAGAAASKNACEAVRSFLFKEAGDRDATLPFELRRYFSLAGNVLFNSLIYGNQKLNEMNQGKTIYLKGGASILAAFMDGDFLAVAHVGLCGARIFREGRSTDLVIPRSFAKSCDPFEVEPNQEKRIPLMALGLTESIEPEIFEYRIRKGDWIFLYTDGMPYKIILEIETIQKKGLPCEVSLEEVSSLMKAGNYEDNVAACLVSF